MEKVKKPDPEKKEKKDSVSLTAETDRHIRRVSDGDTHRNGGHGQLK